MKIGLGGHDLGDKGTSEPVNEIERFVSEIFIHPQYFPPSYKNDLALLKLHAPVSFSPTVIPICIPDNDKHLIGEIGWVTGWGSNYGNNTLQKYFQSSKRLFLQFSYF